MCRASKTQQLQSLRKLHLELATFLSAAHLATKSFDLLEQSLVSDFTGFLDLRPGTSDST